MKGKKTSRTDKDAGSERALPQQGQDNQGAATDATAILDLVRRAEKGDATAMSELRKTIKRDDTWDCFNDMVAATEDAQIKAAAGDNLVFAESLKRQVAKMKVELGGPECSPMERLVVDRIAICWLQSQYADAIYAQNMKDLNIRMGEYYQRRQDRTHRRLLSAIKSLAYVRKLPLAVLQVNIEKQVNIAGGGVTAGPGGPSPRVVAVTETPPEAGDATDPNATEDGTQLPRAEGLGADTQNGLLEERRG